MRCTVWALALYALMLEVSFLFVQASRYSRPSALDEQRVGNCTMLVLVPSARENFASRQRIRLSWKKKAASQNVVFMVGGTFCDVPSPIRKQWTCEAQDWAEPGRLVQEEHDGVQSAVQACLEQEAAENEDLVFLPIKDFYRNLPRKIKEAYRWALRSSRATWFLKADDDVVFVDTDRLERSLCSLDSQQRTVVGRVKKQGHVMRNGKWAEYQYRADEQDAVYPPFAIGSYGHAVSRDVAAAVVDMNGAEYQGEDVSIGIWLDESPLRDKIRWISGTGFVREEENAEIPEEQVVVLSTNKKRKGMMEEVSLCPMAHKLLEQSAPVWAVPLSHFPGQTVYLRANQPLVLAWRVDLDAVKAEAQRSGLESNVGAMDLEFGLVVDGELATSQGLPTSGSRDQLTFWLHEKMWGEESQTLSLQLVMSGPDGPIGRATEQMDLVVREWQSALQPELSAPPSTEGIGAASIAERGNGSWAGDLVVDNPEGDSDAVIRRLDEVLAGCGEICDTNLRGVESKYFPMISKGVNCKGL